MNRKCLGSKALEYLATKECFLEERGENVKIRVKLEDLSEETPRIIKSSQAMNFPWRTVVKTLRRADQGRVTVSGPGL